MKKLPILSYVDYIVTYKEKNNNNLESAINTINYLVDKNEKSKKEDDLLLSILSFVDSDHKNESDDLQTYRVFIPTDSPLFNPIDNPVEVNNLPTVNWINEDAINQIKKDISLDKSQEQDKKNRLNSYLSKLNPNKPIIDISDYSIFEELTKKAPNFKDVADYFKGCFILNHFKMKQEEPYQAPLPILLLGDPGIGKTFFAKELAKSLKTSSYIIDSNSITANWVLTGSTSQWKNAEAGLIFKQMLESPSISPIIIFDEIDKLSHGKSYDPFSTFHQLLEPENAKTLKDEFVGCSFDASNIIYILTANDTNGIPESLLSRMKIINVKKPDAKTTHMIAQNIYSSIIGKSGLYKEKLNTKQLQEIETLTPRELKQLLTNCVYNQTAEIDMSNPEKVKTNQLLIITKDKPKKPFGF
jgi:ATP-dependent Lon protease